MDNISDVEENISLIASEPARIVHGQNDSALIMTFKSNLSPSRIKKVINTGNRRSFFVFELNAETCSAHIDEEHLQEFMFKDLDIDSESLIEDENREFLEEYDETNLPYTYDEEKLLTLTEEERELLIDKLLNNVKNLTNNQKKTLSFLASI
jgi:hypothetical protein